MVLCARDVSPGAELMQDELFSSDEHECPGYDACPVAMCGCRWLYQGIPWIEGQDGAERDNVTDFPAQPS